MSYEDQKTRTIAAVQSTKDDAANKIHQATSSFKNEASNLQDSITKGATDIAQNVSERLKSVGVDTDVITSAAKDKASDLQKMLMDELQSRPMRSLGIAAAIGVLVGIMTAR